MSAADRLNGRGVRFIDINDGPVDLGLFGGTLWRLMLVPASDGYEAQRKVASSASLSREAIERTVELAIALASQHALERAGVDVTFDWQTVKRLALHEALKEQAA